MNMNNNPTVEELAAMMAIQDDNAHSHRMWVSHDGEVHISKVPEDEDYIRANAKFRYETLDAGNDYVGPNAASDLEYVQSELNHLKRDWETGAEGYIDF
jgi:hypothetical protein